MFNTPISMSEVQSVLETPFLGGGRTTGYYASLSETSSINIEGTFFTKKGVFNERETPI
jgi:hypothetical protein